MVNSYLAQDLGASLPPDDGLLMSEKGKLNQFYRFSYMNKLVLSLITLIPI